MHRIETWDGGDYTRITWLAGLPVTIESGIETSDIRQSLRRNWSLYFYVAEGNEDRRRLGRARGELGVEKSSGKILVATAKWSRIQRRRRLVQRAGPAGQDGKLWKFDHSEGQRLLMTVPPYLARSGEDPAAARRSHRTPTSEANRSPLTIRRHFT